MTIMDTLVEFCDATSVAAAAGTALVGNVVDLGSIGRGLGGQPLYFTISVDTAIITGGAAGTVQFKLVTDAQAALATDGTATEHIITHAFVTDDSPTIPVGRILYSGVLPESVYQGGSGLTDAGTYERFLGVLCVTGTTTTTAGKINAWLTLTPVDGSRAINIYADAVN